MNLLDDIGNACLWISAVGIVVFTVQYSMLAAWWRNAIGITIVGEALAILAIYVPSILALADPAAFAKFAVTTWYHYLTIGIVVATAAFIITRIATWELIRRQRSGQLLPSAMRVRVAELEAENAALRKQLAE